MAARHRFIASYLTGMYRSKPARRVRSVTKFERGVWSGKDATIRTRFTRKNYPAGKVTLAHYRGRK